MDAPEPEPHRKQNKKLNIENHAHFLTCSCNHRLPLLTNDVWCTWLASSIRRACEQHRVAVWAYVFMPEHIHLVLKPRKAVYDLAKFEHAFKLSASRRIANALRQAQSPMLKRLSVVGRDGKAEFRFWLPGGGHDLNLWSMKKIVEKVEYCHSNPVKRRLVKSPDEWQWSSFNWLILGKKDGARMVVDDWDESLEADNPA
jgi:putative transposase